MAEIDSVCLTAAARALLLLLETDAEKYRGAMLVWKGLIGVSETTQALQIARQYDEAAAHVTAHINPF
jgi:hypothetical protein